MARPMYCEAPPEETGLPCICGATVEGKDPVHGVCQALRSGPKPASIVQLVLIDKRAGEVVASTA